MGKPMAKATGSATVLWSIYYLDKRNGQLKCMERQLPYNMSKQGIHDYIARMGHTIEKAISDVDCYTY